MHSPANSRVESLIPRPTAFKPGQSGNPRGRRPGTQNERTIEVREVCNRLVDDPEYREALRRRMIADAKGKPVDRVENGSPGAFAEITNDELKARLDQAVARYK